MCLCPRVQYRRLYWALWNSTIIVVSIESQWGFIEWPCNNLVYEIDIRRFRLCCACKWGPYGTLRSYGDLLGMARAPMWTKYTVGLNVSSV